MTHIAGSKAKTVFVLGAGFSREAGFPVQTGIIKAIRQYEVDLVRAPRHAMEVFEPARTKLAKFLAEVFPSTDNPSLEDVFTLLDQTIQEKQHCAGFTLSELEEVLDALKRAILFVLHDAGQKVPSAAADFYRTFCAYLIRQRLLGIPFSVISLNWDCLFEDTLYWCLREAGGVRVIDIDYCCYTVPLGASCPHFPSILQHAKGLFNIKVLKLHGSANWLLCPNCNKMYTGVGSTEEVWSQYVLTQECPTCKTFPRGPGHSHIPNSPKLEPFFLTPTFLKQFSNTHIKTVWHNAYIELAEADRLIFIGYSLPDADYHVRNLLRRAIRHTCSVTAVLTSNAEPKRIAKRLHGYFPAVRYRQFFGTDRVNVRLDGAKNFCQSIMAACNVEDQMIALKAAIQKIVQETAINHQAELASMGPATGPEAVT